MEATIPKVTLPSCGKAMPIIGMGTSSYPKADLETAKAAILEAIRAGYRHFDTALVYGSEKPLGEAISEAVRLGLVKSRDELFITTKLPASFAERDMIVPAIKMSLSNLQLDYVDMYLIHGPLRVSKEAREIPFKREHIFPLDVKSVWEGMEECQNLGLAKGIGVSNFSIKKLEELLSTAKIPPALNQVEMNPMWQQKQLREFCKTKGIHITAYSPLRANGTRWGDNKIMDCDVLEKIAQTRSKTTAQVSIRWLYEQGVSIVAKSINKQRMRENLRILDWSLTEEDREKISRIPQQKLFTLCSLLGQHDITVELDAEI